MISFFLLYIVLIPVMFVMVKPYKQLHKLPYLLMALLAFIRYDTTSDYDNYVKAFYTIRKGGMVLFETGYVSLNKLFSFSQWGFFFVIGICAVLAYASYYSMLKKYHSIFWGGVVFMLFDMTNVFDNIVRQTVAIALFTYSIKYIGKDKDKIRFLKYIAINLIGMLFHTSAFIAIMYYPLILFARKITVPKMLSIVMVLFIFVLFRIGFFTKVLVYLIQLTPYARYLNGLDFFATRERGSGITVLYRGLLTCVPIIFFGNKKDADIRMIINTSWIASLFLIPLSEYWVAMRFAYYLYIFQIISLGMMLKYFFTIRRIPVFCIVFTSMFFFHFTVVRNYYGYHNTYYTLFNERVGEYKFYSRANARQHDTSGQTDFTDRSKSNIIRP